MNEERTVCNLAWEPWGSTFHNRWLACGLRSRRKKQHLRVLVLGQSAPSNRQQFFVAQLPEWDIATIKHLCRLSVQPVSDFANGCQFAFLSPFNQLGRNSAQRKGIAPEFNQE